MKIIEVLSKNLARNQSVVEDWFVKKFQEFPVNFYNSVDLRHNGFKIAPVDTNCFPAGFNNLSIQSRIYAKKIAHDFISANFRNVKNILIIPENHTRNIRYLENILALQEILQNDQNIVNIGSMIDGLLQEMPIDLSEGKNLILQPIIRENNKIKTQNGFIPDLIILNNDLTSGVPKILQNLDIPIVPSVNLGWYNRTKSLHFNIYNDFANEIANILAIDPWLISSKHDVCHNVNFKESVGLECLADEVEMILAKLREKYREYKITDQPYCYIKADNGTYGMAVMPVFSGAEILEINKKGRNKMNMLKESTQSSSVLVQEGIKTIDKIYNKVAEPMIYMIAGNVVGNLFRVNEQRDNMESLNNSGANFSDFSNLKEGEFDLGGDKNNISNIYQLIARLAALASAKEKQQL